MRTCEQCGTELTKPSQQRFCSRACLHNSMKVNVVRTCEQCGRDFVRKPWELTRTGTSGGQRYCSVECSSAAKVGKPVPALRVEPEERICPSCGTSFLVGGRGRPMKDQLFCSVECRDAGRYRRGAFSNILSDTQAAYIAGIVDGEGSIMLVVRRDTVAVRLAVTNSHRGVLDWLVETTGVGRVQDHRAEGTTNRATWMWMLNGDGVTSVLAQIRPYMIVKTEQADLAIETQNRLRDPALKADRTWQLEWKARMQELNRRGPKSMTASSGG